MYQALGAGCGWRASRLGVVGVLVLLKLDLSELSRAHHTAVVETTSRGWGESDGLVSIGDVPTICGVTRRMVVVRRQLRESASDATSDVRPQAFIDVDSVR